MNAILFYQYQQLSSRDGDVCLYWARLKYLNNYVELMLNCHDPLAFPVVLEVVQNLHLYYENRNGTTFYRDIYAVVWEE